LLYDDQAVDVYAYPGAGRGMENVTLAAPGVFTFDRDGGIYTYDHLHATLIEEVATDSVAPYTFAPVRDRHGVVYFLATRDGARFRAGAGQAYCQWPGPEPWPAELNGVNECAGPRGGVTSLQVTARGDLAAFTTADGGVYLYLHASDHVLPLDPEVDSREAACCALSPDGRWVVWVTHAGEAWVMDRWRNETTLIPDLRAIALPGCPPRFTPYDPDHVYLMARPAGFGDVRMVAYDLRTAWIRGLVVLNLMAGM
jgi:hypothetical protein